MRLRRRKPEWLISSHALHLQLASMIRLQLFGHSSSVIFIESHQVHKTVAHFYCTEIARYLLGKGQKKKRIYMGYGYGFKCDSTK